MKRTRVRLDRNVAPCSSPTTNDIGPLHECKRVRPCTKPYFCQAFAHESRKIRERRDRKKKGQESLQGWKINVFFRKKTNPGFLEKPMFFLKKVRLNGFFKI